MPATSVIEVDDLRMRYGDKDVLEGVSFEVRAGEVVALLGANGAGKTTTIEILEGFRMRSAGEVSILGQDPARADETWRSQVGIVLQSWRDHARWTPRAVLALLGQFYAPYSTPDRPRPYAADELLQLVGLSDQANEKIRTLSGGQRRRLDVAIGIVGRPDVLFLDEPTAGFDPEARRVFHELVRSLAEQGGTTVLLTTHDLDEAERLADRILILAGGGIVANGTAAELARAVAGEAEVRWREGGEARTARTPDATAFVRELLTSMDVSDLEVRNATLEDTYLTMVHRLESDDVDDADAARIFKEGSA